METVVENLEDCAIGRVVTNKMRFFSRFQFQKDLEWIPYSATSRPGQVGRLPGHPTADRRMLMSPIPNVAQSGQRRDGIQAPTANPKGPTRHE